MMPIVYPMRNFYSSIDPSITIRSYAKNFVGCIGTGCIPSIHNYPGYKFTVPKDSNGNLPNTSKIRFGLADDFLSEMTIFNLPAETSPEGVTKFIFSLYNDEDGKNHIIYGFDTNIIPNSIEYYFIDKSGNLFYHNPVSGGRAVGPIDDVVLGFETDIGIIPVGAKSLPVVIAGLALLGLGAIGIHEYRIHEDNKEIVKNTRELVQNIINDNNLSEMDKLNFAETIYGNLLGTLPRIGNNINNYNTNASKLLEYALGGGLALGAVLILAIKYNIIKDILNDIRESLREHFGR